LPKIIPDVDSALSHAARRITVVGGGFAGACAAVQLVRQSPAALAITLIDPAERPGAGLAYSAIDPDHRINGLPHVHSLIPDDAFHFARWIESAELVAHDQQARLPDGRIFPRRGDYGRYLQQTLRAHATWPPTGSTIGHLRDSATGLAVSGSRLAVQTAQGLAVPTDQLILATGNPTPRLPPPFSPALAAHPAVVENPLDTPRLYEIPAQARVLLIGASLTALDVLSTLLRRGHRGEIVVVSRRGQRPRAQGPLPEALAGQRPWETLPGRYNLDRLGAPPPAFLSDPGLPREVRHWLRALRREVARVQAEGGSWYQPFDELRDAVWQLWPTLPTAQKRRFQQRLRTWYDVHRFRTPPQNAQLVEAAVAAGRVRFVSARLRTVQAVEDAGPIEVEWLSPNAGAPQRGRWDRVVNCTGLDAAAGLAANPMLADLHRGGWIRRDPSGIGFEVDATCRAIGADGAARSALRLIGLPTAGRFGDPLGAMYIAAQVHRTVPDILERLGDALVAPMQPA
jgi:uncharacterized NAD(P)/FAD-binding protein YdhS